MAKQRRPQHEAPTPAPAVVKPEPAPALESNELAQEELRQSDALGSGGQATAAPTDPGMPGAPSDPFSGGGPLPYQAELEAALGTPLGHLRAVTGKADALAAIGARAAAKGHVVAFADSQPELEQVAEEVVHTLQDGPSQGSSVSSPTDSSEVEAKRIARDVAAGGAVDAVRARASAAIQRDDEPNQSELQLSQRERVQDTLVVVYEEQYGGQVSGRPDAEGTWHIWRRDWASFQTDLPAMHTLRARVLEIASGPTRDFAVQLNRALRGVSPGARRLLMRDRTFLSDPRWTASPTMLVDVANANTPNTLFHQTMRAAMTRQVSGAALVAVARDYARSYPSEAQEALGGGALEISTYGMTEAQRQSAIAYLATGGAEHAPITRARIALQASDRDGFNAAFDELSTDTAAVDTLRNDATFLNQVRDRLGEATFQAVQSRMLRGAAVDNSDLGLNESERDALRGPAGTCVAGLRSEFDATIYTDDSNVLGYLRAYFAAVTNTLRGVTDAQALRTKREEARSLLKSLYQQTYGHTIAGGLRAGVSEPTLGTCLSLIRAVAADTAAEVAVERQGECSDLVSQAPTVADFPTEMTSADEAALAEAHQRTMDVINDEYDDLVFDDLPVQRALRRWQTAVEEAIPLDADAPVVERNAQRRRRAHAILWIERSFAEEHPGKSLSGVLAEGMGGVAYQRAEGVLEGARTVEDEVAEESIYTADGPNVLSAAELARVLPVARARVARIASVVARWVVDDSAFYSVVSYTNDLVRRDVSPERAGHQGPVTGATMSIWNRKNVAAMQIVQEQYDAQHGSLTGDLHRYLQDAGRRTVCLSWLGGAGGENARAEGAVLNELDTSTLSPEEQEQFARRLSTVNQRLVGLARRFADEMDDMIVHDRVIKRLTETFKSIKEDNEAELVGKTDTFTEASFLQYLERAYTPLRGSLRLDITRYVDRGTADECFANLGLGSAVQATTVVDEQGLSAAEITAGRELQAPGVALFHVIQRYAPMSTRFWEQNGQVYAANIERVLRLYVGAAPEARTGFYDEFYEQEHYIRLTDHLGRFVPDAFRTNLRPLLPGLRFAEYTGQRTQDQVDGARATALEEAQNGAPADLRFDPMRVSVGFTVEAAGARATRIHDQLRSMDGNSDMRRELTRLLSGDNGRAEESRVVNAMYRRLYGVDMRVDLQTYLHVRTPEEEERFIRMSQDAGQGSDILVDVRAAISAGSDADLNRVYSMVLMASSADRRTLLADPLIFGEIQSEWGHEAMDRVYRSATGEVTLADALRTRDTSTEWYTFGLGTDEANAREDVKLFFRWLRRELQVAAGEGASSSPQTPAERAAALDASVKERARALFADADVRVMLDEEFGGDELLQMEQLILGAGSQSALNQADQQAADSNRAGLLTQLRAMSDAERQAARQDPSFIGRVRTVLAGREQQEAMSLLFGTKDGGELPALDAALANPSSQNRLGEHTVDVSGRNAVFDAVLGMSTDELASLAADPVRVARIRAALSRDPQDRELFERLLGGVEVRNHSLGGISQLGSANTASGQEMTQADKDRIRQALTVRHIIALQRAAERGEDHLYAAAQSVFSEEGETTVRSTPERKEKLFGAAQRQNVWSAVQPAVQSASDGTDNTMYRTVQAAVLGQSDPSNHRLERGFELWDNDSAIDGAIDNASARTITHEWSNIRMTGPGGSDSMALVYARYVAAREQRDLARENAALFPGQDSEAQRDLHQAELNLLLAHYAFRDFRLDVADSFAFTLSQGGRTHLERREDTGNNLYSVSVETGDSRYQALIGKVRTRVLGLSANDIAEALDISTTSLDVGPLTEEAQATTSQAELYRQADMAELINDDRKDRSRASHSVDAYMQSRGQASIVDPFTGADESVDLTYARQLGAVGQSIDGNLANGDVGSIDTVEHARNDALHAEFQAALGEYAGARAALRDVLTWVAIAVIGAIATALTGPGGPTLMAAMISAAASAGTVAAINEMTMGRDYQLVQEGTKSIVVDTATSAITFGLARGFDRAVASSPFLQSGADKVARFRAWEAQLAAGANQSVSGFAGHVVYSGGKAALGSAMSDFQGATVASMNISEWRYGWDQGLTHAETTMDAALDAAPGNALQALWTTMLRETVLNGVSAARRQPGDPSLGEVGAAPQAPEAQETDVFGAMRSAVTRELSMEEQSGAGGKYALDWAINRAASGNFRFESSDIGSFMAGYARSRAQTVINRTGEGVQSQRTSQMAAEVFAANVERFQTGARIGGLPPEAAQAHFTHFLSNNVRDHDRAFEEWQAAWNTIDQRMQRRLATAGLLEQSRYREWVLADPSKITERLSYGVDEVNRAAASAEEQRLIIQRSPEYRAMSTEQQAFYQAYLASPSRLSLDGGGTGIDIRTSEGRTGFEAAFRETKQAMILAHCRTQITALSEAERERFTELLTAPDAELPVLDPSRPATAQQQAQAWYERRIATLRRAEADPSAS